MIGVDIGGTNLLVGKIENNTVSERQHAPINNRDFSGVIEQVCTQIRMIDPTPVSVGIAVAGSVDCTTGTVLRAQNLNWDNEPLAKAVSDELGVPVIIENDVSAAAWGEFIYGAGKDTNSMFAVWIGTGIGGGLILDGKLWRGPLGTGGEFGMSISETYSSDDHRTLEAFASRSGYQQMLDDQSVSTDAIKSNFKTNSELDQLIHAGAKRIGTSIANAITLLSLDLVILGGGITEQLGTDYVKLIRDQFELDVFPPQLKMCAFEQTKLGPDAGLLGAAHLATSSNNMFN